MISLTAARTRCSASTARFVCNTSNVPFVNPTGYCNPELDEIAADAAAAPLDQQRALYKKYAEIVARDLNQLTLTSSRMFEVGLDPSAGPGRAVQLLVQHPPELGRGLASQGPQVGRTRSPPSPSAFATSQDIHLDFVQRRDGAGPTGHRRCRRGFGQAQLPGQRGDPEPPGLGLPGPDPAGASAGRARSTGCPRSTRSRDLPPANRHRDRRGAGGRRARARCGSSRPPASGRRSSSPTASRPRRRPPCVPSAPDQPHRHPRPQLHGPGQLHRLDAALPVAPLAAPEGGQGGARRAVRLGRHLGHELDHRRASRRSSPSAASSRSRRRRTTCAGSRATTRRRSSAWSPNRSRTRVAFAEAAESVHAAGKSLVVLKVGRSAIGVGGDAGPHRRAGQQPRRLRRLLRAPPTSRRSTTTTS